MVCPSRKKLTISSLPSVNNASLRESHQDIVETDYLRLDKQQYTFEDNDPKSGGHFFAFEVNQRD